MLYAALAYTKRRGLGAPFPSDSHQEGPSFPLLGRGREEDAEVKCLRIAQVACCGAAKVASYSHAGSAVETGEPD